MTTPSSARCTRWRPGCRPPASPPARYSAGSGCRRVRSRTRPRAPCQPGPRPRPGPGSAPRRSRRRPSRAPVDQARHPVRTVDPPAGTRPPSPAPATPAPAPSTGRRRMQNGASDRRIGTARRLGGQSAEIVRRSNAGNAPTPAMHYPVAVFPHYRGFSGVRAGCDLPLILPGDVRVSLSLHRSL